MYIVHIYILKINSLKFKFWFKQTPFIYPKCIFEKVPPSPSPFGQNPKEQQRFSWVNPLDNMIIVLMFETES